jgi:C1A family cysteine protease
MLYLRIGVFGLVFLCLAIVSQATLCQQWSQYKTKFGLSFNHDEEFYRRGVYVDNLHIINQHNTDPYNTYTLGESPFTHLSSEEFIARFHLVPTNIPHRVSGYSMVHTTKVSVSNDTVDWRLKGVVTPVKNQQQCGSCWAFSTTGSVEACHALASGLLISLSEQQLVDCSDSYGNNGCQGGLMDNAFKYYMANTAEPESDYPYTATNGICKFNTSEGVFALKGFQDVTPNSDAALQAAVLERPVSVALEADQAAWQLYTGGIVNANCGTTIDHGVLVVGYGSELINGTANPYWIVKNSWGETWGESGYIRIARQDGPGMCGINILPSYPVC